MTDRELLELAAKAAGIKNWWDGDCSIRSVGSTYWNPLESDGDAFRLAVKCEITIYTPQPRTMQYDIACAQNFDGEIDCCEKGNIDPCAATRRAIVRAAASIG